MLRSKMWPLHREEKRGIAGKWQYRGGLFPHNTHAEPTAGAKKNQGCIGGCSPNSCDSAATRAGIAVLSERPSPRVCRLAPTLSGEVRASLPSDLRSNRQICASAELQGPILLAAAGAESDSGDHRREYDHALHVHGLLSYHVFGNRTYLATGPERSDQERSCLSRGFPRRLMRKCHLSCYASDSQNAGRATA